jgi:hypothetical protein
MYKGKLPTNRKVSTNHRSMNLERQSHLLVVASMSRFESSRLFCREPPRLGQACVSLWSFESFEVRNLLPKSYVNICFASDIASWLTG